MNQLTQLRKRAETRLQREAPGTSDKSPDEVRQLVHELRTHQIELEMQKDELCRTQLDLEAARDKYTDRICYRL